MPTRSSLRRSGGDLRVGYSRRYKECFLRAKEQMRHGRLGTVVGGTARVYNSRAQAFAILARDPHATPVLDVLTYYVDLMCWFLDGNRPVEVVARGQHGIFKAAGFGAHDVTWAIVTFADGAVVNLGVELRAARALSDARPVRPGRIARHRRHHDHRRRSHGPSAVFREGHPHAYVPDHAVEMAFLGSNTAGDWAVGNFWGPLGNETRAWLDYLATGEPTVHTTPAEARINLETTIAIERAVATGAAGAPAARGLRRRFGSGRRVAPRHWRSRAPGAISREPSRTTGPNMQVAADRPSELARAPLAIRRVDAIPLALPLTKPVKMAAETVTHAHNLLVRIEGEDGTRRLG